MEDASNSWYSIFKYKLLIFNYFFVAMWQPIPNQKNSTIYELPRGYLKLRNEHFNLIMWCHMTTKACEV
jgi:hypothetical protein